jgi:hypothetical protein
VFGDMKECIRIWAADPSRFVLCGYGSNQRANLTTYVCNFCQYGCDLRRTLRVDAWAPLDKVLSDPCFASIPADRKLVVEHKLTKDKEVDSDKPPPPCAIPAEVLLNTQTSEAFTIHWIEYSPLQGAQDDVARTVNGCHIA